MTGRPSVKRPLVTVVMSVFNCEAYVGRAIESVLSQTFGDFEFIIINDGSTDGTLKVVNGYKDHRIKLISRENKGLVDSLNEGIAMAQGSYIARQDGDDISRRDRLEKELKAFEQNSKLVIVGSWMETIDQEGKPLGVHKVFSLDADLKRELLMRSPFAHGSVMIRLSAARATGGLYRKLDWPGEDYAAWSRLAAQGEFSNVPEPLYLYRENTQGISLLNSQAQLEKKRDIRTANRKQARALWSKPAAASSYPHADLRRRLSRDSLGLVPVLFLDGRPLIAILSLFSSARLFLRKDVLSLTMHDLRHKVRSIIRT